MAALGLATLTEADMPRLGAISRTEADIRAAAGRVDNPVQRLRDRLFWFHLTPDLPDAETSSRLIETFRGEPEATAALDHDKALHALFAAFIVELDEAGIQTWIQAIRAWHQVIADDSYWSLTRALEERGSFEPTALTSEIDALRDDAVRLAAETFVVAARVALARNDTLTVRHILVALDELTQTGPWAAHAQEDITSPALEPYRKLCDVIREECSNKIVREQDASARNKSICDDALRRFRGEIEPALNRLVQLLPPDHYLIKQSREEAARCLNGIAINFTWADDFVGSEKLNEDALKLAGDAVTAIRIEHGLAEVRDAARKQRVFGALRPISSAPSLSTINGFGFTVYGNSDFDAETHSYVTTHYFVALFIPIFPIARYRVINEKGNHYRFLGKLPLRKVDRWHLWIASIVIVAVVISVIISSGKGSNRSFAPSSAPNSVSSSRSSQLSNLKAQIDSNRSRHAVLEKQLRPVIDELTTLNEQMKRLQTELNALDERQRLQGSIDIRDYNARVGVYNGLLARYRALLSANGNDLKTLDALEKQDSVLVDQYNALLKR